MKQTSTMEKIERYRKTYKIKRCYDLKSEEILEIAKRCNNDIYAIIAILLLTAMDKAIKPLWRK